jgi:hypothetical protein
VVSGFGSSVNDVRMNAPIKHEIDIVDTFTLEFDARVRAQILAVVASLLREHPDATLGDLVDLPSEGGQTLRSLTIRDLLTLGAADRIEAAAKLQGRDFDELVLRELAEHGRSMSRAELIERVGGPRWKLQASMRRLEGAGKVTRSGITSATRYAIAGNAALVAEVEQEIP